MFIHPPEVTSSRRVSSIMGFQVPCGSLLVIRADAHTKTVTHAEVVHAYSIAAIASPAETLQCLQSKPLHREGAIDGDEFPVAIHTPKHERAVGTPRIECEVSPSDSLGDVGCDALSL